MSTVSILPKLRMKLFFISFVKVKNNQNDKDWHSKNTNYRKYGYQRNYNSIHKYFLVS